MIFKRISLIFLITGTLLFATAMSTSPIRAAFWNVIVNWYDDYIGVRFYNTDTSDIPTTIETVMEPSYLPNGWSMNIIYSRNTKIGHQI